MRVHVDLPDGTTDEVGCHSFEVHGSGALMLYKRPFCIEVCYAHGSWALFTVSFDE